MKKILTLIFCVTLLSITSIYNDLISTFLAEKIGNEHEIIRAPKSDYYKDEDYYYVSITKDFVPYSYNDLLDVVYTVINSGWTNFTFYCPSEYTSCIRDMASISNNSLILSHINNFVHPFNSFTTMNTVILESGEINLKVNYLYSKEEISKINTEVDKLIKNVYKDNLNIRDNLKNIHDYIINTTKYDTTEKEVSAKANGALFNHEATCNGYTDLMAIILTKLGIKNFKVATSAEEISYESTGHIWNAVLLDDKWYHLDLTWDDPVSEDHVDHLYHKYFLINTETLKKTDSGSVQVEEHNFDKSIYLEFNDSINEVIS